MVIYDSLCFCYADIVIRSSGVIRVWLNPPEVHFYLLVYDEAPFHDTFKPL